MFRELTIETNVERLSRSREWVENAVSAHVCRDKPSQRRCEQRSELIATLAPLGLSRDNS